MQLPSVADFTLPDPVIREVRRSRPRRLQAASDDVCSGLRLRKGSSEHSFQLVRHLVARRTTETFKVLDDLVKAHTGREDDLSAHGDACAIGRPTSFTPISMWW